MDAREVPFFLSLSSSLFLSHAYIRTHTHSHPHTHTHTRTHPHTWKCARASARALSLSHTNTLTNGLACILFFCKSSHAHLQCCMQVHLYTIGVLNCRTHSTQPLALNYRTRLTQTLAEIRAKIYISENTSLTLKTPTSILDAMIRT